MTQTNKVINLLKTRRYITVRQVEVDLKINSATSVIKQAIKELASQGVKVGRDWGENLSTGKRYKTYGVVKCDK